MDTDAFAGSEAPAAVEYAPLRVQGDGLEEPVLRDVLCERSQFLLVKQGEECGGRVGFYGGFLVDVVVIGARTDPRRFRALLRRGGGWLSAGDQRWRPSGWARGRVGTFSWRVSVARKRWKPRCSLSSLAASPRDSEALRR